MQEIHFQVGQIKIAVYPDRQTMGKMVAAAVGKKIMELQQSGRIITMVFAAAPSQDDFLSEFILQKNIDWQRIIALHMDEYMGIPAESEQSFRYYLQKHLFDHVPFKAVHLIDGTTANVQGECQRYAGLLSGAPVDIVCLGIGENGHIAFNDPPVADFNDPEMVKVVKLDPACRRQQVNDGCFAALEDVPTRAISLTIPALMSGQFLFCTVPGERKAPAVYNALHEPVSTACPATILRKHKNMHLFLDRDSAGLLEY